MDELFRRAAENYPLDTSSADWNKVLAALQTDTKKETISEKRRDRRLLWLLLLLPLGLICNRLYTPGILNNKVVAKANTENSGIPSAGREIPQIKYGGEEVIGNKAAGIARINNTIPSATKQFQTGSFYSNSLKIHGNNALSDRKENNLSFEEVKSENLNGFIDAGAVSFRNYVHEIAGRKASFQIPGTRVDRQFNPLFSSAQQNSKKPIRVAKRKQFYFGLAGGVDATTVRFQKIENAGITYGALFGYQINKKWSLESGVFREKKYYYSEGKYFNSTKVYMPPNSRLDNVSGNCKMIEVPVSLKYNFLAGKNSGWFVTVGGSNYFMKQQNYDYEVYYSNTGTSRTFGKAYKTSANFYFSNLSISGGYTHRLGNFADLRIEPYLKLPISGVGLGNLPLFSTGLQLGITRKF